MNDLIIMETVALKSKTIEIEPNSGKRSLYPVATENATYSSGLASLEHSSGLP